MSLSPYSPPGLVVYVCIAVAAMGLMWRVKGRREPVWVLAVAAFDFVPFVLGASWAVWLLHTLGSRGYSGARDPGEIAEAVFGSFVAGSVITAGLLVFTGAVVAQGRRNACKQGDA